MLSLLVSLVLVPQPIRLNRTFVLGDKTTYRVQGNLQVQQRTRGLNTWMPEDIAVRYEFSTAVKQLKPDGVAVVRYQRPTVTLTDDSGQDTGPERKVEKPNWDYLLTMSSANKLLDRKAAKFMGASMRRQDSEAGFDDLLGEIYRLALFAGDIDVALDLAPPLPWREVAPGETWSSTVSYQPQKLKGKDGKTVMQRLDYTYTYQGKTTVKGREVQRVVGELNLDTDLASYVNDALDDSDGEPTVSKFPLKLKTRIEFDLDAKTLKTLTARATSSGGFQLVVSKYPDEPVIEQKFSGGTTMGIVVVPTKPTSGRK